jgi:hypothetical protein
VSVLPFRPRRCDPAGAPPGWTAAERAELRRLEVALAARGAVLPSEEGMTEQGDPQFYLPARDPAAGCRLCVSRLPRGRRFWYVIEDDLGRLVAAGPRLGSLVEAALGAPRGRGIRLRLVPRALGAALALELLRPERVEAALGLLAI